MYTGYYTTLIEGIKDVNRDIILYSWIRGVYIAKILIIPKFFYRLKVVLIKNHSRVDKLILKSTWMARKEKEKWKKEKKRKEKENSNNQKWCDFL